MGDGTGIENLFRKNIVDINGPVKNSLITRGRILVSTHIHARAKLNRHTRRSFVNHLTHL